MTYYDPHTGNTSSRETLQFFPSNMFKTVIPPSDGESSDGEVFQTFLKVNNITQISDADYQPPSPSANYSQLATFPKSPTPGKFTFLIRIFC